MAKISFSFLLLLSAISIAAAIELTSNRGSGFRAFIEQECRGTQYFQLCVHCLSIFAHSTTQTPEQLAQVALKVSLVRARYARAYITKVAQDLKLKKTKDYQAVHDCLEQINDGVDQLTNSVKELGRMSIATETDFFWHQSNVNSWMSTAVTEALTCMDGISGHAIGSKVKSTIRAKVLNVAQVTTNALDFFNRYVSRHRASQSHNPNP
ncbi:unnamed protein product [Coffea canephora]|uniref:Pectinesterase inhibitor domain-containing protein n=1 Tax=Coffea canephora TaxID=49390 RepID=A0A068TNZ5_COFCA|nr:unnamed protein product [Coffea canephora]